MDAQTQIYQQQLNPIPPTRNANAVRVGMKIRFKAKCYQKFTFTVDRIDREDEHFTHRLLDQYGDVHWFHESAFERYGYTVLSP